MTDRTGTPPPLAEKIFRFLPRVESTPTASARPEIEIAARPENASKAANAPKTENAPEIVPIDPNRPDWASVIDRVKTASEAVRAAEQRAQAAEARASRIESVHRDQIGDLEARLSAAERRAEIAQQRAADAEQWLIRLHDAVSEGFGLGKGAGR